ncbi:MAG: glycosyltransferase family protein [Bacillota bacterium]|nr:glycosyltransferase family protein [Bacillota bacterium]
METDPRKFAFIACVNDPEQYAACARHIDTLEVPPGFTVEKLPVEGARGMAEGYNAAMRRTDARYKIYLHQDTFVRDPALLFHLLELFREPAVGLVGVVGATRLPRSGVWFHAGLHSFGKVWEFRKGGGVWYLLGPLNRRRERLMRFRPVRRPYQPVVVVDGLFMATQHDLPWREDLGFGFIYYEGPQCLEFLKAGYKVVVPHQETVWCMHYGPPHEAEAVKSAAYRERFAVNLEVFRREYGEFIGVHVNELLRRYQR